MIDLPHSTTPCPMLAVQSTRIGSDKYQWFYVIDLTQPEFEPMTFGSSNLPEQEMGALYSFYHPGMLIVVMVGSGVLCSSNS